MTAFKDHEDAYREFYWNKYIGSDKDVLTFNEAIEIFNTTLYNLAVFESEIWNNMTWYMYYRDTVTHEDIDNIW